MAQKNWGQTLSLDLFECNKNILNDPKKLKEFTRQIIQKIKMKAYGRPILKEFGEGSLEGYSLIQFIETSSITIHTDKFGDRVFIDIFSCKTFDQKIAKNYSKLFFEAKRVKSKNYYRG